MNHDTSLSLSLSLSLELVKGGRTMGEAGRGIFATQVSITGKSGLECPKVDVKIVSAMGKGNKSVVSSLI